MSDSTTDLYAAAELLIQPPELEAGDENPSEVLEDTPEPTQQAESDDVEVETESQDDVEASDEDFELDAYDDDEFDQVEATDDTKLIPVKVNGKDENWTLDQLKQSASGQGYINQRMQEIAQQDKTFQEQRQQFAQQQQQFLQMFESAKNNGMQPPVQPVYDSNDPIGYVEADAKYRQDVAAYNQQVQQYKQVQGQRQQEQQQAHANYLAEQAQILVQHIPEIGDPEKGDLIKRSMVDAGKTYGYSQEEIEGVTDSRMVRALNDARKYQNIVKNRAKAKAKGQSVQPVKAGAKKRATTANAATRNKAQTRLQKSGRIEDAIDLLIQP